MRKALARKSFLLQTGFAGLADVIEQFTVESWYVQHASAIRMRTAGLH